MNSNCYTSQYPSVTNFYEQKSVFITGATGFVGKVLLEKLLYSCAGVDKIYFLTRAKKNLTLDERLQQLTKSPVFDRLKASRPEDLSKIIPISGDLNAPNLGLSPEDEETVLEKVFVHISTAYCNTDKEVVEEEVYPPPRSIDDVYAFLEKHGEDEQLTKTFLNGRPNTYSFTKSLSEAYLAENHKEVSTVILRPSIVTAAANEPLVGWIEGWQGNTAVLTMAALGFQRAMLCHGQGTTDLIPVDYVANMAIVAALHSKKGELSVYNCCTSGVKPITWGSMLKLFLSASKADNFHKFPFPGLLLTRSWIVLAVVTLISQTLPAYLMDAARLITGKKAKYVKLNKKIINLRDKLHYFANRHWMMNCTNAQALAASMSAEDARQFPCQPAGIHWPSYIKVYYKGVKKYLFPESG